MKPGERNKFARQLSALRERMGQPGYVVMVADRELLAEVVVALEVRPKTYAYNRRGERVAVSIPEKE